MTNDDAHRMQDSRRSEINANLPTVKSGGKKPQQASKLKQTLTADASTMDVQL